MAYKIIGQGPDSNTVVDYGNMLPRICTINDQRSTLEQIEKLTAILGKERISKLTVNLVRRATLPVVEINNDEAVAEIQDGYVNYPFSKIVWIVDPGTFVGEEKKGKLEKKYDLIFSVTTSILMVNDPVTTPEILNLCGRNTFKLGIYAEYVKQLKSFIDGMKDKYPLLFAPENPQNCDFTKLAKELIKHIQGINVVDRTVHEDAHIKILKDLRALIATQNAAGETPTVVQAKGLIEDLVMWMYTQVQLEDVNYRAFENVVFRDAPIPFSRGIDKDFECLRERLEKFPPIIFKGKSDKHLIGYLPHPMFDIQHSGVKTKMVYSPSPIFKEEGKSPTLQSEYQFFLEILKKRNQRILVVNLMLHVQERNDTCTLYNELAKHSNAKVLGLNRFSSLFTSNNEFSDAQNPEIQNWPTFKKILLDNWFEKAIGHSESCHFINEKDTYRGEVELILDAVKEHYFKESPTLGNFARRYFQDLAFVEIIEYEQSENKSDFCIISCNASADRAPSLYTLLRLKQLLKMHAHLKKEQLKEIAYSLFVPALIHENRSLHKGRIDDFIEEAYTMIAAGPMPTFKKTIVNAQSAPAES